MGIVCWLRSLEWEIIACTILHMNGAKLLEFFGVLMHANFIQFLIRWEENAFSIFRRFRLLCALKGLHLTLFKVSKNRGIYKKLSKGLTYSNMHAMLIGNIEISR